MEMFTYYVHPALVAIFSLNDIPPAVILTGATAAATLALVSLIALSFRVDRKSSPDVVSSTPSISTKAVPKAPHRSRTVLPLIGDTWDAISMGPSTFLTWKLRDECARVDGESVLFRVLGQPDMLVVSDPRAVEDVLKTHFYSFERRVHDTFYELTGDSLFGADGEI